MTDQELLMSIKNIIHEDIAPLKDSVDELGRRMTCVEQRMTGLEQRMTDIEQRITGLE